MITIVIMDSNTNGKESEDMSMDNNPPSNFNELKKSCTDCHTTKTPCWRGGPAGPKTLCNACGIRHRKRMRAVLGLEESRGQSSRRKIGKSSRSKVGVSFKLVLQEERRKKLGEEEQAAILLMALSYGCISA